MSTIAFNVSILPNPISEADSLSKRSELVELAAALAPFHGYNSTPLAGVRILRTEALLLDVPVLYRPGVVFVLQGSKEGVFEGEVFRYDEEHYLSVSVPVPFRMKSAASPDRPLLAVYIEFDMQLAAEIALQLAGHTGLSGSKPKGLVSSRMDASVRDVLVRLLNILQNPVESIVIGVSIMRELHYRILVGPQGDAMIAALQQKGTAGKIIRSLAWIRQNYGSEICIADLATRQAMSVPSYHVHFKQLTGTSPMQYVKAFRLHEARLIIAHQGKTIAETAILVGYASPTQFSRDFKRHFGRTASQEAQWVRHHLGEEM